MKYVIRTSDHGTRIPAATIEEKKRAARDKLLAAGLEYLEYPALLGSTNVLGDAIAEEVTIIEAIAEANYV
jgi:hypothetical protein